MAAMSFQSLHSRQLRGIAAPIQPPPQENFEPRRRNDPRRPTLDRPRAVRCIPRGLHSEKRPEAPRRNLRRGSDIRLEDTGVDASLSR